MSRRFKSVLLVSVLIMVVIGIAGLAQQRGGTLTYYRNDPPNNLDPQRTTLVPALEITEMMSATLVHYDRSLQPVPYLAESWECSTDGKTWRFQLKPGLLFHDGTPVNAEAVKFSFDRGMDSAHLTSAWPDIKETVVVDDLTVELVFDTPQPELLLALSHEALSIISPTAVEKYGEDHGILDMVSCGPYKFDKFITGDRVELVRFEEFTWGPEFLENQGPGYFDRIVIKFIPEVLASVLEFQRGDHCVLRYVPVEERDAIAAMEGIQLVDAIEPGVKYLNFNVSKWPFSDARIRKAITLGIDREELLSYWEGGAVLAYGPISSTQLYYWPGVETYEGVPRYDPVEAENLFIEAGWEKGSDGIFVETATGKRASFELWRPSTPANDVPTSEIIKEQLRQIGVEVQILMMEPGTLAQARGEGRHELFQWGYKWTDAPGGLAFLYHSDNLGRSNSNHWNSPEMDAFLDTARTSLDPEERYAAVAGAVRLVLDEAVTVPLWSSATQWAATSDIGGVEALAAHPWHPYFVEVLELYAR